MMLQRLLCATALLTACGPSPQTPAPVPAPDKAVVEVPPVETVTAPEPEQSPAMVDPQPAPVEELAQSCSGTHLDLQWMLDSKQCYVRSKDDKPAPEGALATRIEPAPMTLAAGANSQAMLVLANTTDAPLQFDLKLNCAIAGRKVTIEDANGKRADVIEKCGYGSGCGGPAARLTLDAKGDARIPIKVAAVFRIQDDDCKLGPEQPMKPGRYTVRVSMPFGPPDATAPLTVE